MEKVTISVVGGGGGLGTDVLRRLVDSIHDGQEVILAVDIGGRTLERTMSEDEKDMFIEHADKLDEPVSVSIRTCHRESNDGIHTIHHEAFDWDSDVGITDHRMLVYEPDPKVALMGGCGIGGLAEYAFRRATQYIPVRKLEPFRGNQRKQIPPRRIHARGCSKRNSR